MPLLCKKVTVSSNVLVQKVADEAVLLDLVRESYLGLNEVAARLWDLLSDDGHVEHALDILLLEFDVDEATLRRDVKAHLAVLAEKGLIQFEANESTKG